MIRLFNHWFHWRPLLHALLGSSFVIVGVIITLMWTHNGLQIDHKQLILFGLIVVVVGMLINTLISLYKRAHEHTVITGHEYLLLSFYLSFPIAYAIYILLPFASVSPELAQLSVMSATFGLLVTRVRSLDPVISKVSKRRILVFGTGIKAHEVSQALIRSDPSAEIVGFFAGPNEFNTMMPSKQIISPGGTLLEAAIASKAQEIVVALSERRGGSMPMRDLLDCKLRGIKVLDLASYFERTLGQIRLDSLYAGWLIFGEGFDQGRSRVAIKRLSDIVFSLILLVMALPVMLVTALLIGLESGFPILYRQERVGLNGRLFNVVKFRSMCNDAERGGMPRWATANDDRITRVGHFIRKLRIDELPQLFSVVMGHMSLIGPRPERPFFVDQLCREIPFYAVRHSVKPGVTGWAQVRYHYGATVEDAAEKLQYDLYYVKNHSLLLDLVILFETVGVVIGRKGAH